MPGTVAIVQIDTPYLKKIYTPVASGLWRADLSGMKDVFWVGDVSGFYTDIPGIAPHRIGSIRVGLDYYEPVSSIAECFAVPGTYVYLSDEHAVILNIAYQGRGWQVPWGKRLEIGIITSYSNGVDYEREDQAYYDDEYVEPIVSSIPDFSNKRDKTFFGVNSYTSIDVELLNHSGKFDAVDMTGNVVRLYLCERGRSYLETDLVQKGFVTKVSQTWKKVLLTVGDKRKSLDTKIDLGKITSERYPYADAELIGQNKIIPIAIGEIENYTPDCIDKENHASTTASYIIGKVTPKYKLGAVSNVWVRKTDAKSKQYDLIIPASGQTITNPQPLSEDSQYAIASTVPYSVNTETGLIIVQREGVVCKTNEDEDTHEITYEWTDLNVNYTGWHNTGAGESSYLCGVDLIRIGIETFKAEEFMEFNFDLSNFAQERNKSLKIPRKYSMLIDGDMTINEYLKKVCDASDTIVTCRGDGRYAVRVRYGTPPPIKAEITIEQLIGRDNSAETTNITEVVAAVEIEYGKAGKSDKKTYADDSRRETIEQMFHISPDSISSSTILADEPSAADKGTAMLDNSESPPTETSRTFHLTAELAQIGCVDSVVVPTGRGSARILCEITQAKKSLQKNTLTWTMIKKSEIKYSRGYTQGNVYGRTVFGRDPYSETKNEVA